MVGLRMMIKILGLTSQTPATGLYLANDEHQTRREYFDKKFRKIILETTFKESNVINLFASPKYQWKGVLYVEQ